MLAEHLDLPLLSHDAVKEALGDSLGLGDEAWSDRLGDAAAEVLFQLTRSYPGLVVEGWWRRERRDRAIDEFAGWVQVFCRCEPALAEERARTRLAAGRHPIHRDVINPGMLDGAAANAASVVPLELAGHLIEVDTNGSLDSSSLVAEVRRAHIRPA